VTIRRAAGVGGRVDRGRRAPRCRGGAALVGKNQIQEASPVPEQTVANVKEDIQEVGAFDVGLQLGRSGVAGGLNSATPSTP
jgi:hypothetical protein